MAIRTALSSTATAGALVLVACASTHPPEPETYVFLVTDLEIAMRPERDVAGEVPPSPGFDLDGVDTAIADRDAMRCADRALDWASEFDASATGVDNQLGGARRWWWFALAAS